MNESIARIILFAALDEGRAAELLTCLFEGGSCTVDANTGLLVLVDDSILRQMMGPQ